MNQTGVASTGSRRQARRKRSFTQAWYYAGPSSYGRPMLRRPRIHARIVRLSPILLRPIREQFEHDRVVRQLLVRWRRRFAVAANPGEERVASTRLGKLLLYPDLILTSTAGRRRLHAVVEVETSESVNHLEAMAQWAHYAKVRGAFYLFVPVGLADIARRLCEASKINVTEIWTYYVIGGQVRFTMVYRSGRAKQAAKASRAKAAERTSKAKKAARARKATTTKTTTKARAAKKPRATKKRKAASKRKK